VRRLCQDMYHLSIQSGNTDVVFCCPPSSLHSSICRLYIHCAVILVKLEYVIATYWTAVFLTSIIRSLRVVTHCMVCHAPICILLLTTCELNYHASWVSCLFNSASSRLWLGRLFKTSHKTRLYKNVFLTFKLTLIIISLSCSCFVISGEFRYGMYS